MAGKVGIEPDRVYGGRFIGSDVEWLRSCPLPVELEHGSRSLEEAPQHLLSLCQLEYLCIAFNDIVHSEVILTLRFS